MFRAGAPVAQHGWPRCANYTEDTGKRREEDTKNKSHSFQMSLSKLTVPSAMAMCQPPSAVRVLTAVIVGSGAIRRSSSRYVHLGEEKRKVVVICVSEKTS